MLGPKYQICYDENSPPQTVDPRQLDNRTMDLPSTVCTEAWDDPLFMDFEDPEHASPCLSESEGIQPASTSPDIGDDTSDGAWNQALQPPESFHSSVPADYPQLYNSSLQIQEAMSVDEDHWNWKSAHDAHYNLFSGLTQPAIDPNHAIDTIICSSESPSLNIGFADGPLFSSPKFLPQSPPPDDDVLEDELVYQTQPLSPSSIRAGTREMSFGSGAFAPDVTIEAPQRYTFYGPQTPIRTVTVLPQQRYKERRCTRMLTGVPPQVVRFHPHGYPVSSVHKGQALAGLQNAKMRAFPGVDVGQKLSWRFLFSNYVEFNEQFNVLDVAKNQPTVERIVFETVKALERFRERALKVIQAYTLDQLVILEIELVSRASVQATVGVRAVEDVPAAHRSSVVVLYG